jgi:hypothetical protein
VLADGPSRLKLLGFSVIGVLGTLSVIVGLVAGVRHEPDAQRLSSILTYAGWILLAIAAVIVLQAGAIDLRTFLADFFPNAERDAQTAAVADTLGLRSLARKDATIDMTFPFGDDVRRVATIFAGTWRGIDVQIFDCWRRRHDPTRRDSEQWTCAILPMSRTGVEIQISRQSMVGRIKDVVAWRSTFDDPPFDHAFRVEAAGAEDAKLVDERVRSRLLEDTPKDRVAIEIEDGRMLYCTGRIPLEERGALLEIAKRLRDAFPAS